MTDDHRQVRLRHVPRRPLFKDTTFRKKIQDIRVEPACERTLSSSARMVLMAAIERNRTEQHSSVPDPSVKIQVIDPIELKDFIEGNRFWRSELHRIKGCGSATLLEIERYATANGVNTGVSSLDSEALESVNWMGLSKRAINAIRILADIDVPTFQALYDLVRSNPEWRFEAFCLRNCGWKTMMEIQRFADAYDLLPKVKGKSAFFSSKEFMEEIKRRKAQGTLSPDKEYPYLPSHKENRSEPPPTNI